MFHRKGTKVGQKCGVMKDRVNIENPVRKQQKTSDNLKLNVFDLNSSFFRKEKFPLGRYGSSLLNIIIF